MGRCGVLGSGGVVTFTHVNAGDRGPHVASAVNGALDAGADTILANQRPPRLHRGDEARRRDVSAGGGSPSDHALWGIQGPGLDFRDEWQGDHAMQSLRHFWEAETRRRGITDRRLIERYPFLAGGNPGDLPNLEETAATARAAVIVAKGDQVHRGIAYGTREYEELDPEPKARASARRAMQEGIGLIEAGDFWGYDQHCVPPAPSWAAGGFIEFTRTS